MKQFIRLLNNKIINTADIHKPYGLEPNNDEYFLHNNEVILKKYEPCKSYYGVYCEKPVFYFIGILDKESDSIFALLKNGDLLEVEDGFYVYDSASYIDTNKIIAWYVKYDKDYILVWDKNLGVVSIAKEEN